MPIKKVLLTLLVLTPILTLRMLPPEKFTEHLHSQLPQPLTLLSFDIGRTTSGNTIIAYALTSIPGIPA